MTTPSMRAAYFRMHLAILLWGFTGLFGKFIDLNEGMLVWYRLLFSSMVIGVILIYKRTFPRLTFREWMRITGVGILVMLHWVTFFGSIKLASISVAMICLSSIALFASVIEPLVNRHKLDYLEILFSGIAMSGIATIYSADASSAMRWGIILGVVSSLISAIFSTFNRRLTHRYEPLTITFIELSGGMAFLTLLFPLYNFIQPTQKFIPSLSDFIYLLVLALACTVFTWFLALQALRRVSAYTMALALNLEPVYGIILAVLFAGEGKLMNRDFMTGAFIILLTVVAHTIYKYRRNKRAGNGVELLQ